MTSRSSSHSYLDYLPAVYSQPDNDFARSYLQIFQKLLTGIDDSWLDGRKGIQELLAAEVIGNLFYPRFSFLFAGQVPPDTVFIPPISGAPAATETALLKQFNSYIGLEGSQDPLAGYVATGQQDTSWQAEFEDWLNDFLCWLGGWVALVVDKNWSIDKKRTVIAEIIALYRLRGTPQGLSMLLNLVLDLPLTVVGFYYPPQVGTAVVVPEQINGQVYVTVANPAPKPMAVSDLPSTAFIVQDSCSPTYPLVSGYAPWLFRVTITLPNASNPDFILTTSTIQTVLKLADQIRALLEAARPAATHAAIAIVPSMQLQPKGRATQLGVNTLLGT